MKCQPSPTPHPLRGQNLSEGDAKRWAAQRLDDQATPLQGDESGTHRRDPSGVWSSGIPRAGAERNRPVRLAVAVDAEPPDVASARLKRQRPEVNRKRKVDRRSGLHSRWPANLEVRFNEQ